MEETLAFEGLSVRFNSQHLPSPPNAPPPTFRARTRASFLESFLHAASLFHAYEYHQSLKAYKRLLRQGQEFVSEAILWFNIGVLCDHLGEHALAGDAYEKSVMLDGSFSVGWFGLGNAISFIGNFRRALKAFKICEKTFQGDFIDYSQQGLPWILERTRVVFNRRQTELRILHKQHGGPLDQAWSLNRLPAGIIFGLGIGVIVGNDSTSTSSTEPDSVESAEPWPRAEVGSPPIKHDQLRRHTATRAGNARGQPPPTPGRTSLVTAIPSQFPSLQHQEKQQPFHNQQSPVGSPNSRRRANAQLSTASFENGNRAAQVRVPIERLDSFGIFALGEPQLRELQAAANEASNDPTGVLGRNRSFRSRE
ncbi:MAG: hypothetical protein M1813_007895 [Trichoglossum hirsutum]|jgi:hypothetical protein|nr:MAG: hypothetical protein M1813_007895 [Trichoglossum hirsutum]